MLLHRTHLNCCMKTNKNAFNLIKLSQHSHEFNQNKSSTQLNHRFSQLCCNNEFNRNKSSKPLKPLNGEHLINHASVTGQRRCYNVITLREDGRLVKKKEEDHLKKQQFFESLQPVIGLEVHAQIDTESKLFSFAGYDYKAMPNTHVSHFDCSFPGTLPVLNEAAVRLAIKTGLAFNCSISKSCTFDRKHYFYPDMPQGYQITQQRNPIATDGYLEFIVKGTFSEAYLKRVKLKQIQLEQDSGKSVVDMKHNKVFIDLNRVGVGLMEFVFEPELFSAQEAVSLLRELHLSLKW